MSGDRTRISQALLPGTGLWVPVCLDCGSVVANQAQHDEWHLEMEER